MASRNLPRVLNVVQFIAVSTAVALLLSGCAFSYGNRYAEAEDLAKSIGVASLTKTVATHTYGTGGFSSSQPTYQVLVTGSTGLERKRVESRPAAKGFINQNDVWSAGDDTDPKTVAIVDEPVGFRFVDSTNHTITLKAHGLLYVIRAGGQ